MDEKYIALLQEQNKLLKLILAVVSGLCLVLIIAAALLLPPTIKLIRDAGSIVEKAETAIEKLETIEEDLSKVTKDLSQSDVKELIESTQQMVNDSSEGMKQALEKINGLDLDTLNGAISDLSGIIKPLSSFFGGFKGK